MAEIKNPIRRPGGASTNPAGVQSLDDARRVLEQQERSIQALQQAAAPVEKLEPGASMICTVLVKPRKSGGEISELRQADMVIIDGRVVDVRLTESAGRLAAAAVSGGGGTVNNYTVTIDCSGDTA